MGRQEGEDKDRLNVNDYVYLAGILRDKFDLKCVTLTGGDPFLYKDFSKLVRKLKKLDIELVALTKGLPIQKWLTKDPKVFDNLDFVYFSIDTLDPEEFVKTCRVDKGAFEVGMKALDRLVSAGVKVRINCVVRPDGKEEVKKIKEMIEFTKEHKVEELRFIELVDLDKVKKPFIEKILSEAGLDIDVPKKPYDKALLKRKKYRLSDGFEFLVLRCMCSTTVFTGEVNCFNQDLYLDIFGKVNTCLEWEVDKNPYVLDLNSLIKTRDTGNLVKELHNIKNGLHPCPALMSKSEKNKLNAGLQLGDYR
jgi:molybdenum cofactor biosynthesis enzyme MoaA